MSPHVPTVVATILVALSTVAYAQSSGAPSAPPPVAAAPTATTSVPSADRSFATKAAQAGTAEINDAQTALKISSRQDVKDFAQRMVRDHTKAADQLKSVASGEGVTLPSGESKADQKQSDALQKLTGAKFDRQYILGQRKAHKEAVALFSTESKSGKDSQLRSFAGQTLPTLQDHLKMISGIPLSPKPSSISP
jgi:putative membrane protein